MENKNIRLIYSNDEIKYDNLKKNKNSILKVFNKEGKDNIVSINVNDKVSELKNKLQKKLNDSFELSALLLIFDNAIWNIRDLYKLEKIIDNDIPNDIMVEKIFEEICNCVQ